LKSVSVVVPVFNEEGNIAELHREIVEVCEQNKFKYEIIIIDDGSRDKTPEIVKSLSPVKYIRLRRNFGQTAAMDAGIKNAVNDFIVTIDGDRQNDPHDIPMMIQYLEENDLDVVSGWRKKRKDNFLKRFVSRGAHFLRNIIIKDGIHDSGCSLKVYKKECFENVTIFGEMHRFIHALLRIKGFKIGEVVVNHRPRTAGKTKYNWKRTIKGFLDMLGIWFWNKYAARPLHLMGGMGLLFSVAGAISSGITIYLFIMGHSLSDTVFPLLTAFLFITGIQFFVSGLISDMLSKNYFGSTKDVSYSIKEVVENKSGTKKASKPKRKK